MSNRRYTPDRVYINGNVNVPVIATIAHPPGTHPDSPIRNDIHAVELRTDEVVGGRRPAHTGPVRRRSGHRVIRRSAHIWGAVLVTLAIYCAGSACAPTPTPCPSDGGCARDQVAQP